MTIDTIRKIFESKMTDRCSIYRRKTIINPDKTTQVVLDKNPILSDVPCRISFIRYKVENPSDMQLDSNPIQLTPKIFFPLYTDIKAGDTVKLNRISSEGITLLTYSGILGLPAYYDTHIEVMLNIDTDA